MSLLLDTPIEYRYRDGEGISSETLQGYVCLPRWV